jgi:hypothetical protein
MDSLPFVILSIFETYSISSGYFSLRELCWLYNLAENLTNKGTCTYAYSKCALGTDFKNVSIVGHYIKERTKDAQFVIIRFKSPLQIFSGISLLTMCSSSQIILKHILAYKCLSYFFQFCGVIALHLFEHAACGTTCLSLLTTS